MNPPSQHLDPVHSSSLSTPSTSSRKRSRENETPSQRHKREKAAERQRRKRERDRQAGMNNILALSQVQQQQQQHQQQQQLQPQPQAIPQQPLPPPGSTPVPVPMNVAVSVEAQAAAAAAAAALAADYANADDGSSTSVSQDEIAKRERVRAAARERQRKHRALVKARKMRELGMDMGNEILAGIEDVQYRLDAEGAYQPMLPHEMPPHHTHPPHPHGLPEPHFPQQAPGGQMFASTLLLSFSCAPLLKQHLLRTLHMTNDELASLEPIIAQAWEHWDQQRRMHQYHHPANGHKAPDGTQPQVDPSAPPYAPPGMAYVHDPSQPPAAPPDDFRARFHRPLVAPSPFRSALESAQGANASVPGGGGGDTIDPASTTGGEGSRPASLLGVGSLDPALGQARDEAAGVAGKLERS
ncbi:uncharacterized protein FIBRA_01014 [Fibroporia radiculosa]|uniref:Uncharacterized protein n=1 Tax=Fibroporia radiculosa TaxID=599839 RepID=J4I892_9APHY|nr:uncharacterized protein FIBRA_01014 [Fibroporia radiculosa]CCL99006.1 predicted protein [Fibroporia radiculosa]